MFSDLKLRNPSSWIMFVFGFLAAGLGILGLLAPDLLLATLGFEPIPRSTRAPHDYTLIFIMTSSMASLNMGIYYMLAALKNVRVFFQWTVPFRCLTFLVFTTGVVIGYAPPRFLAIPLWELLGALLTGGALVYEHRRGIH